MINEIDKSGSWIIEGVYRESQKCLFELADKIIFLDTPLYIRKFKIIKRFVKQKLKLEECHYISDLKMLKLMFKWTNDFERNRDKYMELLETYREKVTILLKT